MVSIWVLVSSLSEGKLFPIKKIIIITSRVNFVFSFDWNNAYYLMKLLAITMKKLLLFKTKGFFVLMLSILTFLMI